MMLQVSEPCATSCLAVGRELDGILTFDMLAASSAAPSNVVQEAFP